jgi:hypothetical protein
VVPVSNSKQADASQLGEFFDELILEAGVSDFLGLDELPHAAAN